MKIRRQRKHRSRAKRREYQVEVYRTGRIDDPEGFRKRASDPNTDPQELLILASFFPREVRRNPAAQLEAISNPAAWTESFNRPHMGEFSNGRRRPKEPRGLENFYKTHRYRRRLKREPKHRAHHVALLCAGVSLSKIVHAIQTGTPLPPLPPPTP